MKLKVGDRVKIKTYDKMPRGWNTEMMRYMGRSVIITKIHEIGDIEIDADDNHWIWYKDEFEDIFLPAELFEI